VLQRFLLVCVLALGLLAAGCPAPVKQEAAPAVDRTPLSQPVSINLNFLGVEGQPDPTAEYLSKIDPDELRLFPIRFPVTNMTQFTKIDPAKDKLRFAFAALWGNYKAETKVLTLEPGKRGSVEFKLADASLRIEPKLLKPDKGIYELTLTLESGEVVGHFKVQGWGEHVPVSGASKALKTKQVYSDKVRRITGYEVYKTDDAKRQQQGLIFMGEGWSTDNDYMLPKWAKAPRIFPEVDLQVYPEYWFTMRDIVNSCHTIKSEPLGTPILLPASFGGGSCGGRSYG